ncbi:hypothetical protein PVS_32 [Vibrio phage vB_VspS_VS-ABTNL-3]|nr:hypothetical protein PVS_32 [Vibrio phage vB_VspS_VS-ABTNL-3]
MSKFNAESFLNQTVEAKLDVRRIPMPEGDHDEMQITDLSINTGTMKSGERAGETWVQLKAKLVCTDPNVAAEMKLTGDQQPTVYWQEFIDLDENGNLDIADGRNIKLGKLRQACNQNNDDEWSINDLKSATLGARITHAFNADGDPYAVVKAVYNPAGDEDEE